MNNCELKVLSNNLFNLLVNLNKKVFSHRDMIKTFPIPSSHARVLFYLAHSKSSSISKIAKDLGICKPNMTPIIDKLIEDNLAERYTDESDRRIIRIKLTEKAFNLLEKSKENFSIELLQKISLLSNEDLKLLNSYTNGLSEIILKLK